MKYPLLTSFQRLAAVFLVILMSIPVLNARIGESRSEIERRLSSAGGIIYRDEAIRADRMRGMPYTPYMNLLERSFDVRVYFKTSDGRNPTQSEIREKQMPDGWDLHVIYGGNESKMEIYHRSSGISDYEMNALLALQADGSYWKKVGKKQNGSNEDEKSPTAFGFDMVRADGLVRAKRIGGNQLMIFDTEFDIRLAEARDANLMEQAPVSVDGF